MSGNLSRDFGASVVTLPSLLQKTAGGLRLFEASPTSAPA